MALLIIFTNKNNPNNWRPYERQALQGVFGQEVVEINVNDALPDDLSGYVVYWKLDAEKTTEQQRGDACLWSNQFKNLGFKEINRPLGWLNVNAKDLAFQAWAEHGIPCPDWGYFNAVQDWIGLEQRHLPCLVRVNDGNTGECSLLCRTASDLFEAWRRSPVWYLGTTAKYGPSPRRGFIRVQFIDHVKYGYRYSYRIVVAGDRVIGGYARLCDPSDWVAITGRFRPEMAEAFLALNGECQQFCRDQQDLIVSAVHSLGLDWQGVDAIFDDRGRPYFLEVQPDYSCGNTRYGDSPPFYNPSYPALVKFLTENEAEIRKQAPGYWENWLDKQNHFRLCAQALWEYLNG